jgi:hypothetical protein
MGSLIACFARNTAGDRIVRKNRKREGWRIVAREAQERSATTTRARMRNDPVRFVFVHCTRLLVLASLNCFVFFAVVLPEKAFAIPVAVQNLS